MARKSGWDSKRKSGVSALQTSQIHLSSALLRGVWTLFQDADTRFRCFRAARRVCMPEMKRWSAILRTPSSTSLSLHFGVDGRRTAHGDDGTLSFCGAPAPRKKRDLVVDPIRARFARAASASSMTSRLSAGRLNGRTSPDSFPHWRSSTAFNRFRKSDNSPTCAQGTELLDQSRHPPNAQLCTHARTLAHVQTHVQTCTLGGRS